MERFKFFAIFILLVISFESLSSLEFKDDDDAILAIGKEMAGTRYMLETYAMIGAKVTYKAPRKRILKEINSFEELLDALNRNYPEAEVQEPLKVINKNWKYVKKSFKLAIEPDIEPEKLKEGAKVLHEECKDTTKALEDIKSYILSKVNLENEDELNAAIEIGTSARGLSSHYAMWMWGLHDDTIKEHWNKWIKIYEDSLDILKKSKFNSNKKFAKDLKFTKDTLAYFKMMYQMGQSGKKFVPALIQEKAEEVNRASLDMVKIILNSK